ncbi:MAG TPA: carboxypeptidase-like regulatory domain-containing protein [Gemmatimonadales bacterium]|nr:carboxypeptidase-like regulatory domain-containing protein [Gemmatimonadales bacterium]
MVLLLAAASSASAQGINGVVTEAESHHSVNAALVQLLPAESDSILASTVTTEQGRFRFIGIPVPRYRVRILRIGFRPWTSEPLLREAGRASEVAFAIPAVPVVLSDITVEAKSSCRSSPADDERLARVWDDARTALALLRTSTGSQKLEFQGQTTRRMVDPRGHLVSENKDLLSSLGAWPISSQPAESLAQLGFVQAKDTVFGPVYYGPDVNVFFSDAFIRTHCFKLVQEKDSTLLGLRFEPAKGRDIPDIEGVLWVSRERNRLRRLEYRYTALWNWVPKGQAGGQLDFTFLPDDRPALTGWSIRAPVARVEDWPEGARVRDATTIPYFGHGKVVLHGFREEAGVVREIRIPGGAILWSGPA